MHLARFPRHFLAHLPTPLERMDRLTAELGGPELWIKRDDCTGLSTGGNKTRKLEFLMAEAEAQGADMVMTQGATQSNHARQTAAFAAKLGMRCHILLEDRTGSNNANYNNNGNVLLDHLHGATTEKRPGGGDMNAEMEKALAKMTPEQRQKLQEMMGGSALDTQGTRICYSKAMLNPSKFIEGQEQDHCKSTLVKSTTTEIVTKFECQDGSKGEANWKISNPSTFAGVVDVTNGKGEKSKMTYQGKFLATDCGKLKPVI